MTTAAFRAVRWSGRRSRSCWTTSGLAFDVYKVDRLTRSLADFAKLVELFDAHGVSFISVTQAFNTTTSMGRLTLNMLLSFAQFEREITGERICDKVAASKRKGIWMGGAVPLGYRIEGRRHRTAGAGSGSSRTRLIHPAPFRAPRILLVVIGRRSASAPASPSRGPGNGILRAETGGGIQARTAGERSEFGSQTATRLANRLNLR